ncbi:hypothetical protein Tco_0596640 [Tanacetum coccineum]
MATSSTEAEYVAAANYCGQFWSTASLRAPELGPLAILAIIDKTPYTITKDIVRSQTFQLGEVAPDVPHTIPKTIQKTRPEPDQSQEHIPTPPRPTTLDHIPPRVEQVSKLVHRVSTLESELKSHKLLFKDVVGQLVKKVKALELKLKTRSQKVVMSESDKEEEEEQDVDPVIKLANAATASDAHVDGSPGADIPLIL